MKKEAAAVVVTDFLFLSSNKNKRCFTQILTDNLPMLIFDGLSVMIDSLIYSIYEYMPVYIWKN